MPLRPNNDPAWDALVPGIPDWRKLLSDPVPSGPLAAPGDGGIVEPHPMFVGNPGFVQEPGYRMPPGFSVRLPANPGVPGDNMLQIPEGPGAGPGGLPPFKVFPSPTAAAPSPIDSTIDLAKQEKANLFNEFPDLSDLTGPLGSAGDRVSGLSAVGSDLWAMRPEAWNPEWSMSQGDLGKFLSGSGTLQALELMGRGAVDLFRGNTRAGEGFKPGGFLGQLTSQLWSPKSSLANANKTVDTVLGDFGQPISTGGPISLLADASPYDGGLAGDAATGQVFDWGFDGGYGAWF